MAINPDDYTLEELQELRDVAYEAYKNALSSAEYIIEDRDIQVKHQEIKKLKQELDSLSEALRLKKEGKSSKIKMIRGIPLGY
jgi:flagellin-specific chaperone FliS